MDHHKYSFNNNNNNSNNNWRNQKVDNYSHYRPRSHSNRRSSFGWQPPSWEKKFCATAGVPWQKVLETKKYMYQDKKVLQWKDSAVKEAFWNAKKRFWAEMHGQSCDIKLPDPDIFIDKIDWDSNIDPDLIMDLEKREPDTPCEIDGGVVVGIPVIPEQYLHTPNGWGDTEEGDPQTQSYEQHDKSGYDRWDNNVVKKDRDIGSTWYNNKKQWNNHGNYKKLDHGGGGDWNKSRYKISRFDHNNNYNGKMLVDDYGSKKGNFGYERPWIEWRPVTRGW